MTYLYIFFDHSYARFVSGLLEEEKEKFVYTTLYNRARDKTIGSRPHRHRGTLSCIDWGVTVSRDIRRQCLVSVVAIRGP